jgi:anthranilate/para-aminobenzoate synthase component II
MDDVALPPILIIDNYDSFTYNLFQMVQAVTEHPVQVLRNDSMDCKIYYFTRARQPR